MVKAIRQERWSEKMQKNFHLRRKQWQHYKTLEILESFHTPCLKMISSSKNVKKKRKEVKVKKSEEYYDPGSCWNKANWNEFVFILLERDPAAPDVVRFWCDLRIRLGKNKFDDAQVSEALDWAEDRDGRAITSEEELRGYIIEQ